MGIPVHFSKLHLLDEIMKNMIIYKKSRYNINKTIIHICPFKQSIILLHLAVVLNLLHHPIVSFIICGGYQMTGFVVGFRWKGGFWMYRVQWLKYYFGNLFDGHDFVELFLDLCRVPIWWRHPFCLDLLEFFRGQEQSFLSDSLWLF